MILCPLRSELSRCEITTSGVMPVDIVVDPVILNNQTGLEETTEGSHIQQLIT